MLNLINNRPVVLSLAAAVMSFAILVLYGLNSGGDIFDFFYVNMPSFIIGSVLFIIPIFVHATRNTTKTDLIDSDAVIRLREYYKNQDNYASNPFGMIVSRLYLELADQRSHATKNLSLGVGFTVIAVILSIFLIVATQSKSVQSLDMNKYVATFLFPKIAAIVFIEGIAMFFLRWYGKNLIRIANISTQLLGIEIKILANHIDNNLTDGFNKGAVVDNLLKTEPLVFRDARDAGSSSLFDRDVLKKLIDRININLIKESK